MVRQARRLDRAPARGRRLAVAPRRAADPRWFSWKFTAAAYASGEGSSSGGLLDLWVIKSVMTLGFALLGLLALARPLRLMLEMRDHMTASGE